MKKTSTIILLCFLTSCTTKVITNNTVEGNNLINQTNINQEIYIVQKDNGINLNLNATVVTENMKNILSTRAGKITALNCQPGTTVKADTLIATISFDPTDPNYQNVQTQKNSLLDQSNNIDNILNSTISNIKVQTVTLQNQITNNNSQIDILNKNITSLKLNFKAQIEVLQNQKSNNLTQIEILQKNLVNLNKQNTYSSGDITSQVSSLTNQITNMNSQLANLENSKKLLESNKRRELDKINLNILNQKNLINNTISDALIKIDEVFGISDQNAGKNSSYDNYLSAKNTNLKSNIKDLYLKISAKKNIYNNLTNDEISSFLTENFDLLQLCAQAMKNSTPTSNTFTQTQIDTLYNQYISLANGGALAPNSMIGLKSNFDNLSSSIEITRNSYDNQLTSIDGSITSLKSNIDTLTKTKENLQTNKYSTTSTTFESNINSLQAQISSMISTNKNILQQIQTLQENQNMQINSIQSQIQNLQLANKNLTEQINAQQENQNIQSKQMKNQMLAIHQQTKILDNNIRSENVLAGTIGVIKAKKIDLDSKIAANSLICQITPTQTQNLKLQIYSNKQLNIGDQFIYNYDNKTFGTGTISYALPYVDPLTQNYIYESKITDNKLKEGDKIIVKIYYAGSNENIMIPLNYIIPKLNGYFVKKKTDNNIVDTQVKVGEMNDGLITIISGLQLGDQLIK